MKIIACNWKMNNNVTETIFFFKKVNDFLKSEKITLKNRIIIAPSFLSIPSALEYANNVGIEIFSQNSHHEDFGAFTGEVSSKMLEDLGVKGVILGHSERKNIVEDDVLVNKKIKSALKNNLEIFICIGENLEEYQNKKTDFVIETKIINLLGDINSGFLSKITIAYEPIWSIGTKKSAGIDVIKNSSKMIKEIIKKKLSKNLKVIYGGSVNNENINEILNIKEIDGVLIGNASLNVNNFLEFIKL